MHKKQFFYRPWCFQEFKTPTFQGHWHLKVVILSALSIGRFFPQEIFIILISVKDWVGPRAIVNLEGLYQRKILMTQSGIEPATFQACSAVPQLTAEQRTQNYAWSNVRPIKKIKLENLAFLLDGIGQMEYIRNLFLANEWMNEWMNK
jgi:hypothetical protein